jgi:hypothetical protein
VRRTVFYADPIGTLAKDPNVPHSWIRQAWASNAGYFREIVTEELARYVSKYATMSMHENWTSVLSKALSCDQQVELYVNVRDLSQRLEPEWRQEFMRLFPSCIAALPPPDQEGVSIYYCIELFQSIADNDSTSLARLLTEINQHGLQLEAMGLTVVELEQIDVPLPKTMKERNPSSRVTALEYARLLGYSEIVKRLSSHYEASDTLPN